MPRIFNIIPNSSFEKFEYDSSNDISIKSWKVTSDAQINRNHSYHSNYSMFLKATGDTYGNSIITTLTQDYNPQHKYYFRTMCKLPETAIKNESIQISLNKSAVSSFYSTKINVTVADFEQWNYYSQIIALSKNTDEPYSGVQLWLKQSTTNNNDWFGGDIKYRCIVDNMILIDLTKCFGEGKEPTKEWCDENIPYFENEYDIDLSAIEMKFVYYDQYIHDKKNDRYYTTQKKPKITFVLKNVGNKPIEDILKSADITFSGSNYPYSDKAELWILYNKNVSQLKIEYKDNDVYCTYNKDSFEFSYLNQRDIFKLKVTLTNGMIFEDTMTLYYVGNYDYITCEVNDVANEVVTKSNYLRILKGTVSARLNETIYGLDDLHFNVPMNIDVIINGIKTSPVNILEKTDSCALFKTNKCTLFEKNKCVSSKKDKCILFEKELYLRDGYNVVDIIITDICGNVFTKTVPININVMPLKPEKKDLLTNFIADDDLKIGLHVGSADLEYETKSAGLEKNILINTEVDSHYFKLVGENANLYRISKDNIPKIEGAIVKRPLNVLFDYVEKIYDGTTDITSELRKLKLDNGYYLTDIHNEQFDYGNSGLVRGMRERKATSKVIFKQNEVITDYITIDTQNVDLSTACLIIDGIECYSLPFSDDAAQLVFENDELSEIFETIVLQKTDGRTELRVISRDDCPYLYKVKKHVIIKYNYIVDTDSSYCTYANSDVGTIQVDFEKAFFATKDVTDTTQLIALNDIKFMGDVLGDTSNNYQIANYIATGKILKRTIYPHIVFFDKTYDGSSMIQFTVDMLENKILYDDVYIHNTYDRASDDECMTTTKCMVDSPDVGENKPVTIKSMCLEGKDAKNYKLGDVVSNFIVNISKRRIKIVINKLRLIRATRLWEIDYTIVDAVNSDNLSLVYNTDDDLDIKVYGGIDKNGNSIHTEYNKHIDVLSMFFNYPFNTDYEFTDEHVQKVSEDLTPVYWKDEARPAEPNTERMDIISTVNLDYPGSIKHTLKPLSDGSRTSYFESKDKEYKLYSGCKVMVTNINLNPLNKKLKNYTQFNSTCETEIEII